MLDHPITGSPDFQVSKSNQRREYASESVDLPLEHREHRLRGIEVALDADRLHPRGGLARGAGGEVADRSFERVRRAAQPLGVAIGDGAIDVVEQAPAVLQKEIDQPARE